MTRSTWNEATSPQERQVQKLLDEIDAKIAARKVSYAETRAAMEASSSAEAKKLAREFAVMVEVAAEHLARSLGRPPRDVGRMLRAELEKKLRGESRPDLEAALEEAKQAVAEKIWRRLA